MVQNAGRVLKNGQNEWRERLEKGVIYPLYGPDFR